MGHYLGSELTMQSPGGSDVFAEGYKRGDMYASFWVENSMTCVSNVYLTQNSSKDKLVSLADIFLLH